MKRLSTLVLALVLAMALAVPMFADGVTTYSRDIQLTARSSEGNFNYLNLKGNVGDSLDRRLICLYRTAYPGEDQLINVYNANYNGVYGYTLSFYSNPAYAINRRTDGQAFMWPTQTGMADSLVTMFSGTPTRFALATGDYKGRMLTWTSNTSGASVTFGNGNSDWNYYEIKN